MDKTKLSKNQRTAINLLSLLFCLLSLYFLITASYISALTRAILAIAALLLASRAIIVANNLRQLFGAYLIGGKVGINTVDALAQWNPAFWKVLADWGLVASFGVASYILFKKQISKKMLVFGIASIFAIFYLVLPYSSLAFQFINLPQITSQISSQTHSSAQNPFLSPAFYLVNALFLLGGFSLFMISILVYSALSILYGIAIFLQSVLFGALPNSSALTSQIPGVAPLIPGLTLPLIAGVVTLALLLLFHEFAHGILARVAKIKVKEIGLLVLGIIPIGAFVEPDEKQMKKLSKEKQSRILIAGIASNLLVSVIMFILVMAVAIYVLPHFISTSVVITATAYNSPAYNVIAPGSQVLEWNGHQITNLTSLFNASSSTPFSKVSVVTNQGSYNLISNASGKIGVALSQISGPIPGSILSALVNFIYVVFALSFLLNFLIGAVNLLPIPSFDGWQIYQLIIKDKKILGYLAWIAVLSIVINVLPWIWSH